MTLTITATINERTAGQMVRSQGSINDDADHNGSNQATRMTDDTAVAGAANIATYLSNINPKLDINGDGQVQVMTDGVLIIRDLLGVRGSALVAGIPLTAVRPTFGDIQNYLASLTP